MFDFIKVAAKNHTVWALLILLLANIAIFWQFYLRGLLPFPGDLLASFFFPWNSGGFAGFDPWTTHKDVIAADVVRQIYPWKVLAFDLIKQGQWPLWNPYNFSGTPLLANLQSSVLFPLNFLFLVLPSLWAYIGMVVFLPFLLSTFFFLLFRSWKLSWPSAVFGAIVASNISYLAVWGEQLVIIQSALFLPLALWAINKYSDTKNKFYLWLVPPFLAFSIFGGHIQTTVYVYLIVFVYALFRRIGFAPCALIFAFSIGISAVQLLPSLELYLHSAREVAATAGVFAKGVLPWQNIITLFAPDYFGNPATGNFWGRDYGNFQLYAGVTALILAAAAVISRWRERNVKFLLLLAVGGLVFSLPPLAYTFFLLKIPVLSSGVPARMVFVFQFAAAVLSAYGFDTLIKRQVSREAVKKLRIILGVYVLLWLSLFFLPPQFRTVTRNNLILPTAVFVLVLAVVAVSRRSTFPLILNTFPLILLLAAVGEYSYFFNKFQPFSPAKFVFPSHPIVKFLQEEAGPHRFFGLGTAYIDSNFSTYFKTYAPEGYDSLYIKRYGELLASTAKGELPNAIGRSDAVFGREDNYHRNRLFDLLGIKYLLDKNDTPATNWEWERDKFPEDRYRLIWQNYKWKVYERKTVLPRVFLAKGFITEADPQKILDKIYAHGFGLREAVVLEENPSWLPAALTGSDPVRSYFNTLPEGAKIVSYTPNKVEINTSASGSKLLFLSDVYYPGWRAFIDGKEEEIYRADYAFRAVPVGVGNHRVEFRYDPLSFKAGVAITAFSVLTLLFKGLSLRARKERPCEGR